MLKEFKYFSSFKEVTYRGGVEIVKSYKETVPLNMRKNFLLGMFPKLSGHLGRQYISREQR